MTYLQTSCTLESINIGITTPPRWTCVIYRTILQQYTSLYPTGRRLNLSRCSESTCLLEQCAIAARIALSNCNNVMSHLFGDCDYGSVLNITKSTEHERRTEAGKNSVDTDLRRTKTTTSDLCNIARLDNNCVYDPDNIGDPYCGD